MLQKLQSISLHVINLIITSLVKSIAGTVFEGTIRQMIWSAMSSPTPPGTVPSKLTPVVVANAGAT